MVRGFSSKVGGVRRNMEDVLKAHECFMELTEPGFKRNGTQTMYDEEFAKKMELNEIVKQMRVACGSKSIEGSMRSRERKGAKTVSTEISCNSV